MIKLQDAKNYEDFRLTKEFKKLSDDSDKMDEIRRAYQNGVKEAIPEMMEVSDDLEKMEQIRRAYQSKKR